MPSEGDKFAAAARERALDASILNGGGRSLAAVYMIGYVLECNLKALLLYQRKSVQLRGSEGHNLLGLWEAAGFQLGYTSGDKHAFLNFWDTSLRYEHSLPSSLNSANLYQGAVDLIKYVQTQIRRKASRRAR